MGSYLGFALGAALVSVLQLTLGQEQMEAWGWRIPFLIAGPLGIIAIYFRLKIEESPTFQATLEAEEEAARHPETGEVLGPVPTYLTSNKGYDEIHGTLLTIPVLVVMSLCIPFTGHLSDKIGRRPVLWIGAGSTVVLAIPAFLLLSIGTIPATLTGLAMIAFPVTFFVANLASALPALFPTAHRYAAMGIAYNFAVAIFGGTAPFVIAALIQATGNDMMPAYYLMATSAIAALTIYFMPESARRHLPGSMPSVESEEAARELVETQDENPLLEMATLPFDSSYEAARAAHTEPRGRASER